MGRLHIYLLVYHKQYKENQTFMQVKIVYTVPLSPVPCILMDLNIYIDASGCV